MEIRVDPKDEAKMKLRVLRLLAMAPARLVSAAEDARLILDGGARGRIAATRSVLEELAREGLVTRSGVEIALTADGLAHLRRALAANDPFGSQHRDLDEMSLSMPDGEAVASINHRESPLAQLTRRKDKGGRPFLSEIEWRAGERLRADYSRGQLMPRLGANWSSAVSSGRRQGGAAELTDAALAARLRVEKAIDAVGPELAGVLIDVCCFLKGLEMVEAERGWPVRSAKIVLKAALGALARHYEPGPARKGDGSGPRYHWGADGYRPSISGSAG